MGCVVWVCVSASPRHSSLSCGSFCALSSCTLPVLLGVCGVGVCAWARFSAAPGHSLRGFLGCVCLCGPPNSTRQGLPEVRGACVRVQILSSTVPIRARVCGVGVCATVQVPAASRHSWLGCWSVCFCVRALRVPCQSWLGFVVRACGFGFLLAPRQFWLGCSGVCDCVCALPAACKSGLGCAV